MMTEINTNDLPLYQKNPLTRFSSRAKEYAQYRPTYPREAIANVLEGLSNISTIVVADIGAGTGISSRLLADRGVHVLAIEPNEAMRQAATPHPQIEWKEGTAENTHLADESVHLVTTFQAFHWFNPEPALQEFCRILKSGGRVAIVWNHRNRKDEFTQEYSQILKQASKSRSWEYEKRHTLTLLQENSRFQKIRHQVYFHQQALDLMGLIGRTQSSSYIPTEGTEAEEIIEHLQKLYHKWKDEQELIYLVYRTDVYLAELKDK